MIVELRIAGRTMCAPYASRFLRGGILMTCKRCGAGMGITEAYCPACGKAVPVIYTGVKRENAIFIPRDKIKPIGIASLCIGLLVLIWSGIVFQEVVPIAYGIAMACGMIGYSLLSQYKTSLETSRKVSAALNLEDDDEKSETCEYCYRKLYPDSWYCTHCGSNRRK